MFDLRIHIMEESQFLWVKLRQQDLNVVYVQSLQFLFQRLKSVKFQVLRYLPTWLFLTYHTVGGRNK